MSWIQRYNLRHYAGNSVWLLPVLGMAAALLSVNGLDWLEQRAGWKSNYNPDAARALFGTLAGALFTFIVFLASSLLLVVQLASAQLTPRILAVVFRDGVTRFALTLFTFTFTFTLAVLLRIHDSVPPLIAHCSAFLCLLSIGVFLFLIDHVGKLLRPSGALRAVARKAHEVIESVYPRFLAKPQEFSPVTAKEWGVKPACTVLSPKDGVFLAFDLGGLVALAQAAGCVIELVPQVGDFVAEGSPLFRVHGKKDAPFAQALCQSVALGQERTMEQDPAFGFRIMVDIASKALSPAINDPTTAVLVLDQLHYLLRSVGNRHLDEGLVRDNSGALRLVYPTPDWDDFVYLAVTEIRQFGGASIQVARRLRALLENLTEVLPPERTRLLQDELGLLHRSTAQFFPEPEDKALANLGDLQGVGGKHSGGQSPDGALKSSVAMPKTT